MKRLLSFFAYYGCHRIPDRCLRFRGRTMPLCARCFGAGIGQVVALVLLISDGLPSYFFCVLLAIPMTVDWSLQEFVNIPSTNLRRVVTGILGGFGVGGVMYKLLVDGALLALAFIR